MRHLVIRAWMVIKICVKVSGHLYFHPPFHTIRLHYQPEANHPQYLVQIGLSPKNAFMTLTWSSPEANPQGFRLQVKRLVRIVHYLYAPFFHTQNFYITGRKRALAAIRSFHPLQFSLNPQRCPDISRPTKVPKRVNRRASHEAPVYQLRIVLHQQIEKVFPSVSHS